MIQFLLLVIILFWLRNISPITVYSKNSSQKSYQEKSFVPFPFYFDGLFHSIFFSYLIGPIYTYFYPIQYQRESIQTLDGISKIHIDSLINQTENENPIVVIVSPGIEGTSHDHYIKRFVLNLSDQLKSLKLPLYKISVINFRGYGESKDEKMTSYHNISSTIDIKQSIDHIIQNSPKNSIIYAVGFSLGSNLLCKYLSVVKKETKIKYAISVSNPFDLYNLSNVIETESTYLMRKFYPLYNKKMATNLANKVLSQKDHFSEEIKKKVNFKALENVQSIVEFSENFSSKIYGFDNAFEYYKAGSCRYSLEDIQIPVLFLNAFDDPLVPKKLIPFEEIMKNENLTLLTTETGGHVAWIGWNGKSWVNQFIGDFIFHHEK